MRPTERRPRGRVDRSGRPEPAADAQAAMRPPGASQRPGRAPRVDGDADGPVDAGGWSARWRLGLETAFGAAWLETGRRAREAGQRLTSIADAGARTSAPAPGPQSASARGSVAEADPEAGPGGDGHPEIGLALDLGPTGGPTLRLHLALWPLPGAALARARAALAGAPDLAAALREGRLPAELGERLAEAGADLWPASRDDYLIACACGQAPDCAHAATALTAFGDALEAAPELLLTLRGSCVAELLGEGPVDPTPAAPALEDLLDDFWSAGRSLEPFHTRPRAPELPLALLRQLGPPGFVDGDLARILGPAYARISERALGLAFDVEATASPPPPRAPRAARRP